MDSGVISLPWMKYMDASSSILHSATNPKTTNSLNYIIVGNVVFIQTFIKGGDYTLPSKVKYDTIFITSNGETITPLKVDSGSSVLSFESEDELYINGWYIGE